MVHGTQETVQEGCDRYVANNIDAMYAASGARKKEVLLYTPFIKTPIFYEPPCGYYPGPFNFERLKVYELKGFIIKGLQKEASYVKLMEGLLRGGKSEPADVRCKTLTLKGPEFINPHL